MTTLETESLIMHTLLYISWGLALGILIIGIMYAMTWNKRDKPKEPNLRSFEFI